MMVYLFINLCFISYERVGKLWQHVLHERGRAGFALHKTCRGTAVGRQTKQRSHAAFSQSALPRRQSK